MTEIIEPVISIETDMKSIKRIFDLQFKNQYEVGNSTSDQRKSKIDRFHKIFIKYRKEIKEALNRDYKKHHSEVDMTEIFPVSSEIKHAKAQIASWMRDKHVHTSIPLFGSSSYIKYEPKGVILIISPWNFPINLTFCPLISAIAAGNCVMIKPSEMTPNASAIIRKIVEEAFDINEVAVIEGGIDTASHLLQLPFNHIFFTGSPLVGKIVMQAAARNLTSVTLELGGKSPTIVDETANIEMAAKRIALAKFANNGQICIAPDYVYVHEKMKDAFLASINNRLSSFYTEKADQTPSYGRIVSKKHYERIKSYIVDAVKKGAEIVSGGTTNDNDHYISPTVMTQVDKSSLLMTNEIFGPVLPVFTYNDLDEVIHDIRRGEKPLALYIFSSNSKNIDKILNNTRAGGGCINHCAVHFYNTNLPFGGSNNSGIGKSHGIEGFKAFSNERGILKQKIPNALDLLVPPFNNFKQKLIDFTIKYL